MVSKTIKMVYTKLITIFNNLNKLDGCSYITNDIHSHRSSRLVLGYGTIGFDKSCYLTAPMVMCGCCG
ncbi:hypothetical protein Hanom_Chr09g00781841 [Helianthus anomalus]